MQITKRSYIPFGYKLMATYVLVILIAILTIGTFSYVTFIHSIREQSSNNIRATLKQIADNVGYKLNDTVRISHLLYSDLDLTAHLRNYEEGWVSYETTTSYLIPKLQNAIKSTDSSIWLSMYLRNQSLPELFYTKSDSEDFLASKGKIFELYHLSRIVDKPWYGDIPQEEYGITMRWEQIENDAAMGNISLIRRLVDTYDPFQLDEIGIMRATVKLDELFQSVDYSKIGNEASIYVLNEKGTTVFASEQGTETTNVPQEDQGVSGDLVIKEPLAGTQWELVTVVPNEILTKDATRVWKLTIIVSIIGMLVLWLIAVLISRYFSLRVGRIVSVLGAFREGDFRKRMVVRGKDEFSEIGIALNEMGTNTEKLIQEVLMMQIQKKESEFAALQAQINPHFLYNTLSSIGRLSKMGENEKINKMILELAKFYRLTLNEGKMFHVIEKEIEHAKAYLAIKQIRYGERMEVGYRIDPAIYAYGTIKLILQPFLENVLEHAWFGDRIYLRLEAGMEDNHIFFSIIDDGVGMSEDTIKRIFREDGGKGYGIRNVDQRIKLHYGNQYGVSLFSRPGIGTNVKILFPTDPK
ncbi:sensor histidine kinase [Paenibacillus sp. YIM B09110]|uniref:sensor histidine kinase n=1 Tax=Paenibacillus sp. YIM B09110 TaxID=3126102 RepID=UPI00301B8559